MHKRFFAYEPSLLLSDQKIIDFFKLSSSKLDYHVATSFFCYCHKTNDNLCPFKPLHAPTTSDVEMTEDDVPTPKAINGVRTSTKWPVLTKTISTPSQTGQPLNQTFTPQPPKSSEVRLTRDDL